MAVQLGIIIIGCIAVKTLKFCKFYNAGTKVEQRMIIQVEMGLN